MRLAVARALLALSSACLGEQNGAWAAAMRAELDEAIDDGRPLRFAHGCLFASLRRMPLHDEGRFILTAYALVLGLLIPMAAIQMGSAVLGFPYLIDGGFAGFVAVGKAQGSLVTSVDHAVLPILITGTFLLGVCHLRLAWVLLDREWPRVTSACASVLAMELTLIAMMSVLFQGPGHALQQGAILVMEIATIAGMARWHAGLPRVTQSNESPG